VSLRPCGKTAGQLRTLFQLGAIGNLSDRQLLERFTNREGEQGELAFSALVERHGPMVLRACQALLRNPHDAHDAFQATFLVLVQKARGLWVQDSLGPWLHRVAKRIAVRSRESTRRRRESERRAAELRPVLIPAMLQADGISAMLHEEIDRLPDRYRSAVILCHLEGLTHEQAAKALSLPVGTVKSRLHRARDLIRERLSRRGLTFSAAFLTAGEASKAAEAVLPFSLFDSVVRAAAPASIHRATESGLISARAIHLVEEVIKTMFLTKLRIAAVVVLLAAGLAASAAGVFAQQGSGKDRGPTSDQPIGKVPSGSPRALTAGSAPAPAYIQQSRAMIIARLEQELHLAEQRLDRTIERVESPDDPEGVRARKTVEALSGLLARVDVALVAAVDQFPTMFDFTRGKSDRVKGARPPRDGSASPDIPPPPQDGSISPAAKKTGELDYDEHSLSLARDRMEWSKRMLEKGYVSQTVYNRERQLYDALKSRIDSDIAAAHDRVEWAKKMHEKGYVTKGQYDQEVLKHYHALTARLSEQALSPRVMDYYEYLKSSLEAQSAKPAAEGGASTSKSTPKDNSAGSSDTSEPTKRKDNSAGSPDTADPAKPKDNSGARPRDADPAKPKDNSGARPRDADPAKPF